MLLSFGIKEALELKIVLDNNVLVLKGYLSDTPLPLKNKIECKLDDVMVENLSARGRLLQESADDVVHIVETGDNIIKADYADRKKKLGINISTLINESTTELYLTIPIVVTSKTDNVTYSVLNGTRSVKVKRMLDSLGMLIKDYAINSKIKFNKYNIFIDGAPSDNVCIKCEFNKSRIAGICCFESTKLQCLVNSINPKTDLETRLLISVNGHGVRLDPEMENSGGGIYYA